jgi:hypothetical protein
MIFFFSRQNRPVADRRCDSAAAGTTPDRRVGGWSVGALNIQQRERRLGPGPRSARPTNFTALRLRATSCRNSTSA